MFDSFRNVLLLMIAAALLGGILIAAAIIAAFSAGSSPDLNAARAISLATGSLPRYWVVRTGDTFTSIAARSHLSVAQLQQLNPRLEPNTLRTGQHLALHPRAPVRRVPPSVRARVWVVHRGDTFTSIAAQNGLHASDIAQLNTTVDAGALVPGHRLRLRP